MAWNNKTQGANIFLVLRKGSCANRNRRNNTTNKASRRKYQKEGKRRRQTHIIGTYDMLYRKPEALGMLEAQMDDYENRLTSEETVARWVDQHLGESITYQETHLSLVGVGGLLEQLGVVTHKSTQTFS